MRVDFQCVCGKKGLCDYCQAKYHLHAVAICPTCNQKADVQVDYRTVFQQPYVVCKPCQCATPVDVEDVAGVQQCVAYDHRFLVAFYNHCVAARRELAGKFSETAIAKRK
ncbi:MAG: hypothetical protein K2R98_05220 [Gemmataceae bacterium]|nr:hypothetical protein [Gemmataceae bacterium]